MHLALSKYVPSGTEVHLSWAGWSSTMQSLMEDGWEFEAKRKFVRSSRGRNLGLKCVHIYMRNHELSKFGRFTIPAQIISSDSECNYFEIDYLVTRKQINSKVFKVDEYKDFTVDDIPMLFDIIRSLQEGYPKLKKHTASAELINLADVIRLAG